MLEAASPQVLCLSTGNAHKLAEFQAILGPLGYRVIKPPTPLEVEEDGATFAANAIKKAQALMDLTGTMALADDSGLEVLALGGKPGVHSARYAEPSVGQGDQDARNRHKLLAALAGIDDRRARFVCTIACCSQGLAPLLYTGTVEGHIATTESGTQGFGYDAIFVPSGHEQSFADMTPAQKNTLSHRARALQQLVAGLREGGLSA